MTWTFSSFAVPETMWINVPASRPALYAPKEAVWMMCVTPLSVTACDRTIIGGVRQEARGRQAVAFVMDGPIVRVFVWRWDRPRGAHGPVLLNCNGGFSLAFSGKRIWSKGLSCVLKLLVRTAEVRIDISETDRLASLAS